MSESLPQTPPDPPRFSVSVALSRRGKQVLSVDLRPTQILVSAGGWAILLGTAVDTVVAWWPELRQIIDVICRC